VSIEPEDSAHARAGGEAAQRPERHRMVAAQNERRQPLVPGAPHPVGDVLARGSDLREEARPRVALVDFLGHDQLDVAGVDASDTELLQMGLEPRVADRRGAHVHTAPAGPEIERGADDRQPFGLRHPAKRIGRVY
jgi:hypothetical protein